MRETKMNLKLVPLTEAYKPQLEDMMAEWIAAEGHTSPSAIFKNDYHNFDYYVEHLDYKPGEEGHVPSTTLFALDVDRNIFVGAINIRHYLNEGLLATGGHIGDGIRPSERRKGFATEMIRQGLEVCRNLGIDRVLMVCRADNEGSRKSIMNNGGVKENEVWEEDEQSMMERYWIQL